MLCQNVHSCSFSVERLGKVSIYKHVALSAIYSPYKRSVASVFWVRYVALQAHALSGRRAEV